MQPPRIQELKLQKNLKTPYSQHRGIRCRNTFSKSQKQNPKVEKNLVLIVIEMLAVENKVKASTVVGSVKKQRLFNMDVNVVGKRSSEDELEANVEQPDFRNICHKAKVTKYLRSTGAYNAITDDRCVLVKEFRDSALYIVAEP